MCYVYNTFIIRQIAYQLQLTESLALGGRRRGMGKVNKWCLKLMRIKACVFAFSCFQLYSSHKSQRHMNAPCWRKLHPKHFRFISLSKLMMNSLFIHMIVMNAIDQPIVHQLLRILGTLPASVASAKRSFSLSRTPENVVENENDSDQDDWIGITEHQQRH